MNIEYNVNPSNAIRVTFWTSVQMGVMLTEKYNRQILIFIDDVVFTNFLLRILHDHLPNTMFL